MRSCTARVTRFHRALLAKLGEGNDLTYIVLGVYAHDDAYQRARRVRLQVNEKANVLELVQETEPDEVRDPAPGSWHSPDATARAEPSILASHGFELSDLLDLGLELYLRHHTSLRSKSMRGSIQV
jgi:hypothetical protein